MLNPKQISNILFLDIETVPQCQNYQDSSPTTQYLWGLKTSYLQEYNKKTAEELYAKAGIYAEFGKIVCISVGYFRDQKFRIRSFAQENEKTLLEDFAQLVNKHFNKKQHLLCAHNGKEFDFPFIARRMLINKVEIPNTLNSAGKKPWEVKHLDTMELWKFGDYKHYTSLQLLAHIFNIPTPKDDISGADVAQVYYKDKDLNRIVAYCQKDVITIARLYQCFVNLDPFTDDQLIISAS
jgi:uncharacterized protein YprB with RNaseH-like and TPR domain